MGEPKHTPGPWMVLPPAEWEGDDGEWIVRSVARCGRGKFSEANAHLIAAAPDLLAALKDADLALDRTGARPFIVHGVRVGEIIDAAIAKAEGKETAAAQPQPSALRESPT